MRLHRTLDGEDVQPPIEWVVSRVCEEYGCLPSQAVKEIMDDPDRLALEIIELRAYARAKQAIEDARQRKETAPTGEAVERVYEIQHLIVKEDRENER